MEKTINKKKRKMRKKDFYGRKERTRMGSPDENGFITTRAVKRSSTDLFKGGKNSIFRFLQN